MKGLAPVVVLAAIIGAVLLMTLTGKTRTATTEMIVACPVKVVISAVESALVEAR